jgi:hypothetical protein
MPLVKYAADPNADEPLICGGCPFYPTKIEAAADRIYELIESKRIELDSEISISEIVGYLHRAFSINNKQANGAQLIYPTSLSNLEWRLFDSFNTGKNLADNEKNADE